MVSTYTLACPFGLFLFFIFKNSYFLIRPKINSFEFGGERAAAYRIGLLGRIQLADRMACFFPQGTLSKGVFRAFGVKEPLRAIRGTSLTLLSQKSTPYDGLPKDAVVERRP